MFCSLFFMYSLQCTTGGQQPSAVWVRGIARSKWNFTNQYKNLHKPETTCCRVRGFLLSDDLLQKFIMLLSKSQTSHWSNLEIDIAIRKRHWSNKIQTKIAVILVTSDATVPSIFKGIFTKIAGVVHWHQIIVTVIWTCCQVLKV